MLAITFGREDEREGALDAIRAIHRRVHGTLAESCGRFPAGTPYSAEDPALLLWVHATLIDSILRVYDRLVTPLTDMERDAYCVEAPRWRSRWAPMRTKCRDRWPDLQAYLAGSTRPGSSSCKQARVLAAAMLAPCSPPSVPVTATSGSLVQGCCPGTFVAPTDSPGARGVRACFACDGDPAWAAWRAGDRSLVAAGAQARSGNDSD